ncbi:retrotransposon gag protein, partial [Trifolium medium]|nr:retrotransposon gag protein [Trifolium medium]
MEQMHIFTGGMKIQHRMHLDASTGWSIKLKTDEEVKELIEQMCQNEYNMNNERSTRTPGVLQLDKETACLKEIDVLKLKLAEKAAMEAKVKSAKEVCDFCQEDHSNGHCTPEGNTEEANYAGNFQRPNPYANSGWRDNPNPRGYQNTPQGNQQPQQPRKPSPLEE